MNLKHITLAVGCAATLFIAGCAGPAVIDGKKYKPYGLANEESRKDPAIRYEVSFGSAVVAIIFSETVIMPVYVVGWDLWKPVAKRPT